MTIKTAEKARIFIEPLIRMGVERSGVIKKDKIEISHVG